MTRSFHFNDMTDVISREERERVKKRISGKRVSVIFDGATHVAEALNILRFVSELENQERKVEQRLVRLLFVTKTMKGEELAQQLMTSLSTEFGISSALLLGAIRDRASVNDVAFRHLNVLYPKLVDMGCFNHTLDHVGENMATPLLDTFVKASNCLLCSKSKSKNWLSDTNRPKSCSATRWWSKFEVINQIHYLFGDVPKFLNTQDLPEVTKRKLLQIISDPQQLVLLKM